MYLTRAERARRDNAQAPWKRIGSALKCVDAGLDHLESQRSKLAPDNDFRKVYDRAIAIVSKCLGDLEALIAPVEITAQGVDTKLPARRK